MSLDSFLLYAAGGLTSLLVVGLVFAVMSQDMGGTRARRMTAHLPPPNLAITATVLHRVYHHVYESEFAAAQGVLQAQMTWIYQNQQRLPMVLVKSWFRLRSDITRALGLQRRPEPFAQRRCEELRVQVLQLTRGLLVQLGAADLVRKLPDWNAAETAGTGTTHQVIVSSRTPAPSAPVSSIRHRALHRTRHLPRRR